MALTWFSIVCLLATPFLTRADRVQIGFLALGALRGLIGIARALPCVAASMALEDLPRAHDKRAALDFESLCINQRVGNFASRRLNNTPERLARDVHAPGRSVLVKPFQIRQPQCFKLVNRKSDLAEIAVRHACGNEAAGCGKRVDFAATRGSGHGLTCSHPGPSPKNSVDF